MNFGRTFSFVLAAACIFAGTARAEQNADPSEYLLKNNLVDGPQKLGDSGIDYPSYASIEADLKSLAQKYPGLAQVVQYGVTPKGLFNNMLRIANARAPRRAGRPAVEISGAIHGNEYLGIEMDLLKTFVEHPETMPGLQLFLSAGGVIYFIPVVNPDGFMARSRGNSRGADLNRDWDVVPTGQTMFKQPETTNLAKYLEADLTNNQLQLRFAMDYHCCVPGLISPWTYKNAYPTQTDLADYNQVAQWEKQALGFPSGNAMDIAGYNAVGSTLDYYYAKYHTIAFTIEGEYKGEGPRLRGHMQLLNGVFQKLAMKSLGLE
jgi:succinylglutamate desuccinylase